LVASFIDDLEKAGVHWATIRKARSDLAKLETLLASLCDD